MRRAFKGMILLPRRLPEIPPLPPVPPPDPVYVINPDWEKKAALRKAKREAYEREPATKRRRAIQATIKPRLTQEEWRDIQHRYFYRCYYCGEPSKRLAPRATPTAPAPGGSGLRSRFLVSTS